MATSALAVVMMRPGTGVTPGTGRKVSGSTPTGTTCRRSGSTPWSLMMSPRDDSETVRMRVRRWATRLCIFVKAYQRPLAKRW